MKTQYWLMKSEPDTYSIDQLEKDQTTWWEGVRNYQARNFMMNSMKVGDQVLFYHSNAEPSGAAGLAEVSHQAVPDKLQFDKKSEYFDPKATKEKPIWHCVQVKYKNKLKRIIPLSEMKTNPELAEMLVIKKGQRLSIQPITENEYQTLCRLGALSSKK